MGPKEVKALNRKEHEAWSSMCDRFGLEHIADERIQRRRTVSQIHLLAMGMSRVEWISYSQAELGLDTTDAMLLWQNWSEELKVKRESEQASTDEARLDSARRRAGELSVDALSDAVIKKMNLPRQEPVRLEAQLLDNPLTGDL